MDFPVTRALISKLPDWVQTLAATLPDPIKMPLDRGGYWWRHPIQTAEVVQTAKAVRLASGLAAALKLADAGFTGECGTLLRTISDFAFEIIFIAQGLLEGQLSASQDKFVADYFKPLPTSADELAQRERDYYVSRKDMQKAHHQLAEKAGLSGYELSKLTAFLNKGYDSYVHGAYETAMELYHGVSRTFMLTGHQSAYYICISKTSIAGKLYEGLSALEFMVITRKLELLHAEIRNARNQLEASGEQSGATCLGV